MKTLLSPLQRVWSRFPWIFTWVAPALFFFLCTAYYQGTLGDCTDLLMGGPGDQTAGLIWLHTVSPDKPLWGFTNMSNFPYGESLHQAVQWSGAALYFWYWLLSKVAGPVCGYNLLNIFGFFSAALIMYAFAKWLTRQPLIALLAGYAVSFTPYFQIKSTGHPSYVYQGVLILIIWLFVMFWRQPQLKIAMPLGALVAASFYIDPYFVLFDLILIVALFGVGIAYDLWTKQTKDWRQKITAIGSMVVVGGFILLPLIYIRIHYAGEIGSFVGGSRNNIRVDAQIYSARPWEYLAPVDSQPVLKAIFGPDFGKNRDHHISNPAEYSINLSLTLLALVITTVVILWRRWRKTHHFWPKDMPLRLDPRWLVPLMVGLGFLAFAFSLAPNLYGIRMPSFYLTVLITMWRVFARLYVLVNISLVTLAVVSLAALWPLIKNHWHRVGLILLLFAGVAFEYQVYTVPRPVWSFRANIPETYYWLAGQKDIQSVADYSLDEEATTPFPTYTRTYDIISHKKLVNSVLPDSPQAHMRGSLRNIHDPQTVPALRALGVDAVIVHGVNPLPHIDGLELIHLEINPPKTSNFSFPPFISSYPMGVYRILDGPKASYETTLESGFIAPTVISPVEYEYVGGDGATMDLKSLPGHDKNQTIGQLCFAAKATAAPVDAMLTLDNRQIWEGTIEKGTYQPIQLTVPLDQPVTLITSRPGGATVKITQLGCRS